MVQTLLNCGPVPLEDYPISQEVWLGLGFEIYKNGDGSHGAHIPMWLRTAAAAHNDDTSPQQEITRATE